MLLLLLQLKSLQLSSSGAHGLHDGTGNPVGAASIAGPYHYDRSMMQIAVTATTPTTFTVRCSMYGAPCPGRPGATGDGGNWTTAAGTILGGVLRGTFDYHGGLNDTGTVKGNASGAPPTLSWRIAGTWNPGRGILPPPPPPPPSHGYAITVTERNVAPSQGGGAVISKENKSSTYTYNFNSAYCAGTRS